MQGARLFGKDQNGRQRLRCVNSDCRRTYNILIGTTMARARYLGYLSNNLPIRKIIDTRIEISHRTTFHWRHRFLKAAQGQNAAILSGVIEAEAAIEPTLDGRVAAGSVLCSDGAKAYVRAVVSRG